MKRLLLLVPLLLAGCSSPSSVPETVPATTLENPPPASKVSTVADVTAIMTAESKQIIQNHQDARQTELMTRKEIELLDNASSVETAKAVKEYTVSARTQLLGIAGSFGTPSPQLQSTMDVVSASSQWVAIAADGRAEQLGGNTSSSVASSYAKAKSQALAFAIKADTVPKP